MNDYSSAEPNQNLSSSFTGSEDIMDESQVS